MSLEHVPSVETQLDSALNNFKQNVGPRYAGFILGESISATLNGEDWAGYWQLAEPDGVYYERFSFLKKDATKPVVYSRVQDGSDKLWVNEKGVVLPDGGVEIPAAGWREVGEDSIKIKLIEVIKAGIENKKKSIGN